MALAGVFGIGGAKLAGYAQRTAASFDSGMYSISADLDARLNAAADLYPRRRRQVSRRYFSGSEEVRGQPG